MYADDQKFGKPYKFKVFVENESKGINRIPKSAKIIKCKNCSKPVMCTKFDICI
jgi:hypothetical protein